MWEHLKNAPHWTLVETISALLVTVICITAARFITDVIDDIVVYVKRKRDERRPPPA